METEEDRDKRLADYNLEIGQKVLLRCRVIAIGPNCTVRVQPEYTDIAFRVHRNEIANGTLHPEEVAMMLDFTPEEVAEVIKDSSREFFDHATVALNKITKIPTVIKQTND